jgi:hypothetical protein
LYEDTANPRGIKKKETKEKKNNTMIPVPIESSYLSIGRKLPTIRDGLYKFISPAQKPVCAWTTYMLWLSRLMVNEKQQVIPSTVELGLGLLRVQLVSMAFCVLSKAIAPNFSQ